MASKMPPAMVKQMEKMKEKMSGRKDKFIEKNTPKKEKTGGKAK